MSINGSNDLKSQEVKSYELGYRVKPQDNLFFDVSVFYNEYDHLFSKEHNPTAFSVIYDNKMYGETYGTEIAAHWQANENWKLSGGYSFLQMQIHMENSSTDATTESRQERESPHNMFHLNSQLNLTDNLEFDTMLYYVDNVPHYSILSYIRLDIGLTWHISQNMDFSIVGQNLLDRAHPEFGDGGVIATETQCSVLGKLTWRF